MSTFPGSPHIIKGGIVLINPETSALERIIRLQYNRDTLTRSFQIKSMGGEGGDRSEALRLTGPSVETIKLNAEIDATDQRWSRLVIHPDLAALEMLAHRTSAQLNAI